MSKQARVKAKGPGSFSHEPANFAAYAEMDRLFSAQVTYYIGTGRLGFGVGDTIMALCSWNFESVPFTEGTVLGEYSSLID
jgi:hypothetical protein